MDAVPSDFDAQLRAQARDLLDPLRGCEVKLEAGAGQDAKGLATQFEQAKASA
jgi:hypothetical protein